MTSQIICIPLSVCLDKDTGRCILQFRHANGNLIGEIFELFYLVTLIVVPSMSLIFCNFVFARALRQRSEKKSAKKPPNTTRTTKTNQLAVSTQEEETSATPTTSGNSYPGRRVF